jgi:pimeloyl-ACP methyl ester carboxylesterase
MPFASTHTGATLHYEQVNPTSEKIPVVLIHGLLGTGKLHFSPMIDWLAGLGYQVIAPSLRGYGQSTPKPRDFPYGFYHRDADDVLAFLEALDMPKVHLLGYSDGGEVALVCAGKQPEHFATVTTIGSVGYQGPELRQIVMGYRPGSQWITEEECEMHGIPDADAFSAGWVRSMVMLIDSGGDVAVSLAPKISAPLLMMLGETDRLNPRHLAEKITSQAPNGKVMMFRSGHPVHDEQREAFQEAFLQHIRSVE